MVLRFTHSSFAVFFLLWPQQRKQNHFTNGLRIGQQHHQPVDADAQAAGRRHAVTQRADEIMVHLGHRLFFRQARQLAGKKLFLQIGIVQLGVGVGHFHALDV